MAKLTQPQTLEQKVDVKIIVPYQQNPYFTGRQAFLQDLKRKFHTQNPMQINHRIALHGMGGVGKTQCALAYIYANQNDYERIYWISGVNQASLLSGYQNIARKEGLQLIDSGSENPVEAARMTLSWLKDQRSWLLVIDNLDDIGIANQLLPENSPTTHTLITTRDRNAAGIPAEPFEVGVLDSTDAIQLLLNLSKISVSTDTPQHDQAAEIVQELGYLPLAIEQAAAYIREVTHDLHLYSQQYLRNRKALQKWVPKGNRQYTHSIATTWSMSFEAIRSHPQASKLLHLLAFLNPDGTMLEFLEAGADALDGDLRSMLGDLTEMAMSLLELEKSSIIKWDRGRGIIVLHRLVQVAVIDDMSPDQRDMNLSRIIRLFSRAFPMEIIPQTRHICRTYQNQILEPLLRITICTAEVASIKERVGKFLSNDGKYREAEELFLQAVGIRSRLSDPEDAELLASKLTLASIYWNQGRTTEAVKLEEEVLNTRKRIWGMENQSTLAAMNNLALTYLDQGRILEAMKLQEEVLKMERLVLGEDHVDTLAAMNNLAWTYRNQGRAKEAVELQEAVLEKRRRILGEDDPATLKVMDTLALSYRDLNRVEDALNLQKAVLEARRRQFGDEHPHTLTATLNLASTYWDQNCFTEAAELEEHVLEMSKKLFGIEHRDTLTAMHNLGCTYRDQGRFAEAVDLQEQVLEKRQRTLGERHPDTLKTMHTLARTYSKDGSFERAAELEEEVVKMRKEVLGKEHPDTLRSLQHLAEIRSELSENEAVGEELALGKVHRHTEMLANNSQVNGT
jgi:tetratricopeptide (TPR) repeat protein